MTANDNLAARDAGADVGGFAGKTILVVGAGRHGNIACATAHRLAAWGASIAAVDLPGSQVEAIVAGLPGGARHTAYALDITDRAGVQRVIDAIVERHGRIDGAVIASAVLKTSLFLDITPDDWDRQIGVNVTGNFNVAQAVSRAMVAHGGRIVLVASNAARVPRMTTAAYGASKAALLHLAHCMALELAPYGITVNTLCPGSTATTMAIDNKSGGDPAQVEHLVRGSLAEWRTGIPLGKLADPEDQAAAAVFLLSDAARHITGQSLCVDGGQTFF